MDKHASAPSDAAAELTRQGYSLIDSREFDEALEVSDRLRGMRYSSAFEIAALAHAGRGEIELAVQVLEEGVTSAPGVWVNWQLLGNYRSDLGMYTASQEAYEQALRCSNVDRNYVRLNQAVLASRMEKPADALALLEDVVDDSLKQQVALTKSGALRDLGRTEEAWEIVTDALAEFASAPEDCDSEIFADLTALSARLMLDTGEPTAEVREALVKSLGIASNDKPILAVIREIDNCTSSEAKYFRVLLDCPVVRQVDQPEGYFFSVDVIADDREEVVSFLRNVYGTAEEWKFVVDDIEILEDRPNELKGVYRATARHYYHDES